MSRYTEKNNLVGQDIEGDRERGEIVADISTSFVILLAIFFPSCTGRWQPPLSQSSSYKAVLFPIMYR